MYEDHEHGFVNYQAHVIKWTTKQLVLIKLEWEGDQGMDDWMGFVVAVSGVCHTGR